MPKTRKTNANAKATTVTYPMNMMGLYGCQCATIPLYDRSDWDGLTPVGSESSHPSPLNFNDASPDDSNHPRRPLRTRINLFFDDPDNVFERATNVAQKLRDVQRSASKSKSTS